MLLGWAFENEAEMIYAGRRFQKQQKQSKCNASLGGAFGFKENCILCWGGRGKAQHLKCFARLGLRKHDSATLVFASRSLDKQ